MLKTYSHRWLCLVVVTILLPLMALSCSDGHVPENKAATESTDDETAGKSSHSRPDAETYAHTKEVVTETDEETADKLKRGMSETHTTLTQKVLRTDVNTARKVKRGESALLRNDYDLAIKWYSEAIRLDPKLALAYSNRGLAYGHRGEYDKAMADYTEAIRLDPNLVVAYNNRAAAYLATGEYEKAIADCTEAIRLGPKQFVGYNSLGWLLATCPDAEYRNGRKAVENATEACQLTQGADKAGCLDTLAAAYAEAGEFEEAVRSQTKAIELLPPDFDKTALRSRLELYRVGKPYRDEQ